MPNYRVSLAFAGAKDAQLNGFAGVVIKSLTDNPAFPQPPVSVSDLTAGQEAYLNAMVAAMGGGVILTVIKKDKRAALINLLRQNAAYVQSLAAQDLTLLLSSGYLVRNTNRTPSPLLAPRIHKLTNGQSTQLIVKVKRVPNAKAYEVQYMNGGDWLPGGVFGSPRGIVLQGLTPGQVYTVRVRGVGGSRGYSDWSNPISHMSM